MKCLLINCHDNVNSTILKQHDFISRKKSLNCHILNEKIYWSPLFVSLSVKSILFLKLNTTHKKHIFCHISLASLSLQPQHKSGRPLNSLKYQMKYLTCEDAVLILSPDEIFKLYAIIAKWDKSNNRYLDQCIIYKQMMNIKHKV